MAGQVLNILAEVMSSKGIFAREPVPFAVMYTSDTSIVAGLGFVNLKKKIRKTIVPTSQIAENTIKNLLNSPVKR
ncbi:MAG: hypothetical protein J5867_09580, partial [Prevotella sp.]|nr:hypothetical protein [Prevotella sp.]